MREARALATAATRHRHIHHSTGLLSKIPADNPHGDIPPPDNNLYKNYPQTDATPAESSNILKAKSRKNGTNPYSYMTYQAGSWP